MSTESIDVDYTCLGRQALEGHAVKELMGHGNLSMTERYSHLAPDTLRRAVKILEDGMLKAKHGKVVSINED